MQKTNGDSFRSLKIYINNLFLMLFLILSMQNYGFALMEKNNVEINSLESIQLGGYKQWIYITGDNINNPVLLIIHGGPGFAMLPLFHLHNKDLEKKFTVVNWDQRGAGRSYNSKLKSITLEDLVSDAHELTQNLKSRFGQNKIFILGHSTGSIISVFLVRRYPEDYFVYIGVGQVVNFAENEQLSYDFALKKALKANNTRALKELTRIGRPDILGNYRTDKNNDDSYDITTKWVEYYGGELYRNKNLDKVYDEIFGHPIYKNSQNQLLKGYEFSTILFDNGIRDFDAENQAESFDIPVYLFSGKHDHDTPIKLAKRYYDHLKAPTKEFVIFKNSAHFPFYEEPAEFDKAMIDLVLPNAQSSK